MLKPSAEDSMSFIAMVWTRSFILVLVATSKTCAEGQKKKKFHGHWIDLMNKMHDLHWQQIHCRFHVYSTAIIFTILNSTRIIVAQNTSTGLKNKTTKI